MGISTKDSAEKRWVRRNAVPRRQAVLGVGKGYFHGPCGKNGHVLSQEELKLDLKKNFLVILVKKPHT